MSNEITVRVGLPSVIAGNAKELRVDIARDPEGDFLATESFTVEPDTEMLCISANAGTHVTVSVRAIDDEGQSSKPITKRFQAKDPICPELADNMTVKVVTNSDAAAVDAAEASGVGDDDPPAEPAADDEAAAEPAENDIDENVG